MENSRDMIITVLDFDLLSTRGVYASNWIHRKHRDPCDPLTGLIRPLRGPHKALKGVMRPLRAL